MADGVFIPTLLVVSLSLATIGQLSDLAEQTSDKTIAFATDATNALDCAYTARPLDECSPDLFSYDFKEDADRTRAILEDLQSQQLGHLEDKQRRKHPVEGI